MALKRTVVGSFNKSKDPSKPNYIKLTKNVQEGQYIRLESPKYQRDSLEKAIADGKISGETAEKVKERLDKIPSFVLAECVVLSEV